jgi:hypothetical protein
MIKLTEVQAQVIAALARLAKKEPEKWGFSVEQIRDQRVSGWPAKERVNLATYFRTTQNALRQLNKLTPMLTNCNAVSWKLSPAGKAVAETQLGVK